MLQEPKRNENLPASEAKITTMAGCSAVKKNNIRLDSSLLLSLNKIK
jgi:hypothetical protein